MKRRRCAAVLLGSGVVLLSAACGSSSPSAVAPAANGSTMTAASQPSTSAVDSQSSNSPTAVTNGRQPCSRPATMNGFLKLNSATAAQGGGTQVSITIVNCSVDPVNDEDVEYTPVSTTSALITTKAPVQVLTPSNNLQTVSGSWLVSNQVVNTPYFYYQENADHQITAMQEIYHP
jgi:hypothetical protein